MTLALRCRHWLTGLATVVLCLTLAGAAHAQGAIQQLGPGTSQHLLMWADPHDAMDAGGSPGAGLQPLNQANAGTLPTGLGTVNTSYNYCAWTGYANAAYSELCAGFDGSGNVLFLVDRVGDSFQPQCHFLINGVLSPCAGGGGGSGTVTSITATAPIVVTPSPITTTGVISHATSGVTPGTYTLATLTVDQFGHLTAASNGSAGAGTVISVTANNGLTASPNPITSIGTIGLAAIADHTVLGNQSGGAAVPTAIADSLTIAGHLVHLGGTQTLACADISDAGTACPANTGTSGHTLPFLDGNNTFSGNNVHTGSEQFDETLGAGRTSSATTESLTAADCGTTVFYTANSAVTVTIPASIVPANNITCYINVAQMGSAKVSVNGSAVTAATLRSDQSFTGTSGTQYSVIGLTLSTVSAVATAVLTGAGS